MILAYDFPPFVSVGGLRPYSWFRYLGEFGVRPVVITRQWENHYGDERDYIAPSATPVVEVEESEFGTIVRTPYTPNLSHRLLLAGGPNKHRLVRKLITAWYEIGQYYATIGPKVQLYHAARLYLADHKVDAIIATGEPFVLFKYAAQLSKESGVPWVADYRDAWSQNKRRILARILPGWEAGLERRYTASASAMVTVSDFLGNYLAQPHPERRTRIIPNGYDPEAMAKARGVRQGQEAFTVAFTGTVHGWHPVESVLRVFDDFIRTRPNAALALHMIGVGGTETLKALLRTKFPHLAGNVRFTRRLPNDQAAIELAKANAFLLFNNYAYVGTKVFDYLALKRRIILCYSDDPEAGRLKRDHYNLDLTPGADERVLEKMVEDTKSGVVVKDANHLSEVLAGLHREFKDRGSIACEPVGTSAYSRKGQAQELARVLKDLRR